MVQRLFRDEVIEVSRNRLTGTVVAAVPPSSKLYTVLLATGAALFLMLLVFGSYTTTREVRGVVAYDVGVARVYPRSASEVSAIHVKRGQQVVAGQPLVTLAVAQGQGGITAQLTQLMRQDAELARQLELAQLQVSAEMSALDQQHVGLGASIASLQRQQSIVVDQIHLAQSAARRAERLASERAGTQRQVEDSRSALLARRRDYEALGEQIISQRNALGANGADRSRRQLDGARTQSILLAQRAALAEQQAELSRANRLVLTSPVTGTVGDVSAEIGQQATPQKSAVSVIPSNSTLEVWLYAPSRAVGNARPGQKVRLQFDAFPYQKFGAGEGRVKEVARVPTEPTNVDSGLKVEEPVFRVRTTLVKAAPRAAGGIGTLRPGMTLSGKLLIERQSLSQVLLGPIFEALR